MTRVALYGVNFLSALEKLLLYQLIFEYLVSEGKASQWVKCAMCILTKEQCLDITSMFHMNGFIQRVRFEAFLNRWF